MKGGRRAPSSCAYLSFSAWSELLQKQFVLLKDTRKYNVLQVIDLTIVIVLKKKKILSIRGWVMN